MPSGGMSPAVFEDMRSMHLILLMLAGCGQQASQLGRLGEGDGPDAGSGGPVPCAELEGEACIASSRCVAYACCPGDPVAECLEPGEPPNVFCPAIPCAPSCFDLDPETCAQTAGCQVKSCDGCPESPPLTLCHPVGAEPSCPDLSCPPPPCEEITDEASCNERDACAFYVCSNCEGEPPLSTQCLHVDTLPPPCPRPECLDCDRHGEDACIQSDECHAVYVDDSSLCGCTAPGCCTEFIGCAPGPAQCSPPVGGVFCDIVPPECDSEHLTVGFVPGCYEGCVRLDECVF